MPKGKKEKPQDDNPDVNIHAGAGSTIVVDSVPDKVEHHHNPKPEPIDPPKHHHCCHNHTVLIDADYHATREDYYIGIGACHTEELTVTLPEKPQNGREIIVKLESHHDDDHHESKIKVVGAHHTKIDGQHHVHLHNVLRVIFRGSQWHSI